MFHKGKLIYEEETSCSSLTFASVIALLDDEPVSAGMSKLYL